MFSTSSIIDNLKQEKVLEYKKLCRILKISKRNDKEKLNIAATQSSVHCGPCGTENIDEDNIKYKKK